MERHKLEIGLSIAGIGVTLWGLWYAYSHQTQAVNNTILDTSGDDTDGITGPPSDLSDGGSSDLDQSDVSLAGYTPATVPPLLYMESTGIDPTTGLTGTGYETFYGVPGSTLYAIGGQNGVTVPTNSGGAPIPQAPYTGGGAPSGSGASGGTNPTGSAPPTGGTGRGGGGGTGTGATS